MEANQERPSVQLFWAGVIFVAALALAGIYSLITHGTYDSDEFVYLLIGNGITHGIMPYRDALFFHPPGIVYIVALMNPLIQHSWVLGRSVSIILEAATCSLVYLVARRFCSRAVAITAGLLCAASPIILTTGTRIMPDIYITFFTFLAVYLLLVKPSTRWAVIAGVAFGIAILFKYPALLILPACLALAGKRRWVPFTAAMVATVVIVMIPFLPSWHQFYNDTVVFQSSRAQQPLQIRMIVLIGYTILLQPFAIFGLFQKPRRWWLILGYVSAFAYIASPQVYYHYVVQEMPFAAILGAMYLATLPWLNRKVLVPATAALCLSIVLIWGAIIEYTPGQNPLRLAAFQIRNVLPVEAYIRAHSSPNSEIIDDRPEVPVLSNRYDCLSYFWSDAELLTGPELMRCTPTLSYVVHTFSKGGYPSNSLSKWNSRYCRKTVGSSANGAFVYNLHCLAPYLPTRN